MWEKIKDTFGLPIIMIGGFFYVLFMIFRFFFISPFVNWFENIRDAKDKDKGIVILRGIAIILGIVALIAIGVYNNYGSSYDYERDHYNEYRRTRLVNREESMTIDHIRAGSPKCLQP